MRKLNRILQTSGATQYYRHDLYNSSSMGIYGEDGYCFGGRITVPDYDMNGCIQGLICRRPDNRGKFRWVKQQSGQTCIHPAGWLYGINKAAEAIKRYKTIILVEGIFDFFAFSRAYRQRATQKEGYIAAQSRRCVEQVFSFEVQVEIMVQDNKSGCCIAAC